MKRMKRNLLVFLLVVLLILPIGVESANNSKVVDLTILGTSDVHGNILGYSYEYNKRIDGGLIKLYSYIDRVRKENPNTILLDNGDTIQGNLMMDELYLRDVDRINPIIDVMNQIGFDAMVLGNHEFNYGMETVAKIEAEANFPMLAANVYLGSAYNGGKETNVYRPYTVINKGGIKVGVVGLTHHFVPQWDGEKVASLQFKRIKDELPRYVNELREKEKVDLVVVSIHEGLGDVNDPESVASALKNTPGIDLALLGHKHIVIKDQVTTKLVGAPGRWGEYIVRFDVKLKKMKSGYRVIDKKVEVVDVKDEVDSEFIQNIAGKYDEEVKDLLETEIGFAKTNFRKPYMYKGIPEIYTKDTPIANLINIIQLNKSGADISAASYLMEVGDIVQGKIKYKDLFKVANGNAIAGVEVTGLQLKNYLEYNAGFFQQHKKGSRNVLVKEGKSARHFDSLMGLNYKIDVSEPEGSRIKQLNRNGEAIVDEATYKIAMNTGRLQEMYDNGIFTNRAYYYSNPKYLRSIIADHIIEQGTIYPKAEDNWQLIGY